MRFLLLVQLFCLHDKNLTLNLITGISILAIWIRFSIVQIWLFFSSFPPPPTTIGLFIRFEKIHFKTTLQSALFCLSQVQLVLTPQCQQRRRCQGCASCRYLQCDQYTNRQNSACTTGARFHPMGSTTFCS